MIKPPALDNMLPHRWSISIFNTGGHKNVGFRILIIVLVITSCETIKVLTTTEDLTEFIDGSGAKLKNSPAIDLVDATVCFRIKNFLTLYSYLISSKSGQLFGVFQDNQVR